MFDLSFRYAYLVLTIPFILVWLILFFMRKDTRKEQLRMSYIAAIIGPLSEIIYFRDYWLPQSILPIFIGKFPFMIEDVIFGFAIGGIAAIIYEIIFKRKLSGLSKPSSHTIRSIYLALVFVILLFGSLKWGLNSIYASAVAFLGVALIVLLLRHDLFANAIGSGLGVMFIMFFCYFLLTVFIGNTEELLKQGWLVHNSGLDLRIANIPLTEMTWGFTWGFLAGPWYEFASKKKSIRL